MKNVVKCYWIILKLRIIKGEIKMRIVKFDNGKFAIEKGIIFKKYWIKGLCEFRRTKIFSSSYYFDSLKECQDYYNEKFPKRLGKV
jgi:hypothetical protein